MKHAYHSLRTTKNVEKVGRKEYFREAAATKPWGSNSCDFLSHISAYLHHRAAFNSLFEAFGIGDFIEIDMARSELRAQTALTPSSGLLTQTPPPGSPSTLPSTTTLIFNLSKLILEQSTYQQITLGEDVGLSEAEEELRTPADARTLLVRKLQKYQQMAA
ncbi:Hypothetical protein D9617_13g099660 [Elsinoe fawcettii]|nr:Hypothetical protein D9617_13g099660 [Elsinoe fawcettii]